MIAGDARRLAVAYASTCAVLVAIHLVAFYGPLYRAILDPASTSGSFERAVASVRAWRADARRDVLVIGDSRVYAGLDPGAADAAEPGLRFVGAGVPGTDPRCWWFFTRAVDPHANRFRALVIPVDAYADDTSAIGSLDAADHAADLRYVVFETSPLDIVRLARSFDDPERARSVAFDTFVRGPILRDDVQSLVSDPGARVRALRDADPAAYDPATAHPRTEDLTGLRVDFAHDRIAYPAGVSADERTELEKQILSRPAPSESYRAYRETWLAPIVRRYAAAHVPVVFVRIPTRPEHRASPGPPSGSIPRIARAYGATLLAQDPYVALERPNLFADHDHLDAAGSRLFSARLAHDVARALAAPSPVPDARLAARPPVARTSLRAAFGVGVPLLFQSVDYALFLAIVLALFYGAPRAWRPAILLIASYAMYLRWNAWYVVFLAFLTGTDFAIGLAIARAAGARRRSLLALGIFFNLAFLGTFKYLNFGTATVAAILGRAADPWFVAFVVPVGISFHTFQSISYLVDVASARIPPSRRLRDYALYLAFFPQLLAGPIVRAGRFFGELNPWSPPRVDDVERGVREIALGLVKKLAIADQFARVADATFGAPAPPPSAVAAWCAAIAFAIQIYFDFSGYSDIAIGSARLFGFAFPDNFRRPYFAASIAEFWRRWHISLSSWLRDYVYVPLGGNRGSHVATYRNLFVTMLLGGLWHGANWTFVAWGAYHGAALAIERAAGLARARPRSPVVRLARVASTFLVVTVGWVLFRSPTFGRAFDVYHAMVAGGWGAVTLPLWPSIVLVVAAAVGLAQERGVTWNWRLRPVAIEVALLAGLTFAVELLAWPGEAAPFVYFRF